MPPRISSTSDRATLLVDGNFGRRVIDNEPNVVSAFPAQTQGSVGFPGTFGRNRMVTALPLNNDGPVKLRSPIVLADPQGNYLVDILNEFTGQQDAIWVHRLLTAVVTGDTRRLAG